MKQIDIFGSQIQFRFQGNRAYNTGIGSFFTIAISTIVMIRLVMIVNDIQQRKEPTVLFKERQVNSPEQFIMNNKTLQFAFGMQDGSSYTHFIDPTIYTIKAQQLLKKTVVNAEGKSEDQWVTTEVKVQKCSEDNFQNKDTKDTFMALPIDSLYCLDPESEQIIEGDYAQPIFQQFMFQVSECKGANCKSDPELKAALGKAYFAIYFSDVIVDPVIKDNPFKFYNRDLFWTTSLSSPKDLNLYYRNNYVESDYGWVTEDIQVSRYVSYSTSDLSFTEGTDYFLQLILRFEKQKENVYQRKYKNLTNIISEIGGFTQTMLAVGFIICTSFSELMLNKSIINDAFNFQTTFDDKRANPYAQNQNQSKNNNNDNSKINNIGQQTNQDNNDNARANSLFMRDNDYGGIKQPQKEQIQEQKRPKLLSVIQNQISNQRSNQSFNGNEENGNKILSNMNILSQQDQLNSPANPTKQNRSLDLMKRSNMQAILSKIIQNKLNKTNNDEQLEKSENNQEVNKNLQRKKTRQTLSESKYVSPQDITDDKFKKLLHQETNSMKLSVLEYLKYFFWPFGEIKRKKQIIDYSIQKLYHHLDVIYVIKKLLEVDKLKKLIMDSDQIKLFEYLPKPTISDQNVFGTANNQEQQEYDILYQDNRTEIQKLQDAYQAFQKIQRRESHSLIDQKILSHLDPQLIKLFNYKEGEQENQQGNQMRDDNQSNTYQYNQNFQNIQQPIKQTLNENEFQNKENELFYKDKQRDQVTSPRSEVNNFISDRYFDDLDIDDRIPVEETNKNTTSKQLDFAKNPMHKKN